MANPPAGLNLPAFRTVGGRASATPVCTAAKALVALLSLIAIAGCATTPAVEPAPPAPDLPLEGITRGLADFVQQVQDTSPAFDAHRSTQVVMLLDAQREHAVLDALERRRMLDSRLTRRASYVLGTAMDGDHLRLWVGGSFSRFWSVIALSSRGWRRSRPGVWHDGEYTEVTLHGAGLVEITLTPPVASLFPVFQDTRSGGNELRGRPDGPAGDPVTIHSVFARIENEPTAVVFLGTTPEIGLGSLQPESVLMQLDVKRSLAVDLQFVGEREARVMLVGIRLGSRRMLETLRLTAGEAFAITRSGGIVRVEDLIVGSADIDRFIGAVTGGDTSEGEERTR